MIRQRYLTPIVAAFVGAVGYALLAPAISSAQHEGHGGAAAGRKAENWAPVDKMHLYLCAFHVAKEKPSFTIEAHHFCAPCGDLHQCVIYDSRGPNPKLLGVEYIIGNDAYQKLPKEEKRYWHPHAYEITSGQLIAPDMPKEGDDIFPGLINTWGKTWHTWRDPSTEFPVGEPMLMWSANKDGQIPQSLVDHRDQQFGIKTADIRERRKAMGFAVPQLAPPKSMKEVGRRWTKSGPDEPTKLK